jgi:AGZA family xanthine/uracil permease-like MFS transporter
MTSVRNILTGLDRFFELSARGSTWRREIGAGVTTFLTMAYILFLNPAVLGDAITVPGVELRPQLLAATALSAVVGCLLLGLLGRYPVAAAPAMGLNAYFAYSVVQREGVPWQIALGAVFLSGLIGALFSFSFLRRMMLAAFPQTLRLATIAGIGLFLMMLGLQSAGVLTHGELVPGFGEVFTLSAGQAAAGLALLVVLHRRRIPGGMVIAVATVSAGCILAGAPVYDGQPFAGLPDSIVSAPVWPTDLFLAMDVWGVFENGLFGVVAAFAFVDLFDTVGALMGLAGKADMIRPDGSLPRAGQVLAADALASVAGAAFGMSPTTAFVESAAGIQAGGRTGITAVVVAALFGVSLFMWPLVAVIPAVATAPLLIFLGALMLDAAKAIHWDELPLAVPAAITIGVMGVTMSIAYGIVAGVLTYCGWQWAYRGIRQVHWATNTLAVAIIGRLTMLAVAAI